MLKRITSKFGTYFCVPAFAVIPQGMRLTYFANGNPLLGTRTALLVVDQIALVADKQNENDIYLCDIGFQPSSGHDVFGKPMVQAVKKLSHAANLHLDKESLDAAALELGLDQSPYWLVCTGDLSHLFVVNEDDVFLYSSEQVTNPQIDADFEYLVSRDNIWSGLDDEMVRKIVDDEPKIEDQAFMSYERFSELSHPRQLILLKLARKLDRPLSEADLQRVANLH